MVFTDAALYFRTVTTTKVITPDPGDLPANQFLAFNDTNRVLVSITEEEQPNVSDDPAYDAGGTLVVEKQFNGTFGYDQILIIKTDKDQTVFRKALRAFTRKVPIEPAYHEFGIFGFFHPDVTDFNVDPTNDFGYTMDRPSYTFIHGHETVDTRITLRIGGRVNLIP